MELNSVAKSSLLNAVRFYGRLTMPAKSLTGFDKRLRTPDDPDALLASFGKMATADVEQDLDKVYEKLKSAFGFKRRELVVDGPVEGSGSITTPAFEYRIDLMLDVERDNHVIWQRSVGRIHQPEIVFSDEFQKVFRESLGFLQVDLTTPLDIEAIIDHVEDSDGECTVEYDRDATWCEINTQGSNATMRIEGDQLSVKGPTPLSPTDLFECYWQLQEQFLETIDLPS